MNNRIASASARYASFSSSLGVQSHLTESPRRRVVVTAAGEPVIIHFGALRRYLHDCVQSIQANACAHVAQEAWVKSNCDRWPSSRYIEIKMSVLPIMTLNSRQDYPLVCNGVFLCLRHIVDWLALGWLLMRSPASLLKGFNNGLLTFC